MGRDERDITWIDYGDVVLSRLIEIEWERDERDHEERQVKM